MPLRADMLRHRVGRVCLARHIEHPQDVPRDELLEEANATCYVRETLDRRRVIADADSSFVVAPHAHGVTPEYAERDELEDTRNGDADSSS